MVYKKTLISSNIVNSYHKSTMSPQNDTSPTTVQRVAIREYSFHQAIKSSKSLLDKHQIYSDFVSGGTKSTHVQHVNQ